jgi:antitoxin ParD1/3/4
MTSMNISLSEQMKSWVEQNITNGQYHNASEYIRHLIRADQAEASRNEAFRAAIALGRNSDTDARPLSAIVASAKSMVSRSE